MTSDFIKLFKYLRTKSRFHTMSMHYCGAKDYGKKGHLFLAVYRTGHCAKHFDGTEGQILRNAWKYAKSLPDKKVKK